MVKLLAVSLASVAAVSPYCEAFNSVDNRRPSSVASAPLKKPTVASHVQITRAQLSSSPTDAAAFSLFPSLEGRSGLDASDGVDIAAEGTSFDSHANSHLESFASNGGGGLEFTPLQTAVRASVPLVATSYLFNPQPLDDITTAVWSAIYNWGPTHLPLFEADVASIGFFAPIVFFSGLHLIIGEERTRASRLDGKMPTRPFEWAKPQNFHLWFNPLASYLGSIWVYHQFLHEKPPLPEIAPTFGVFAGELLFGVFLYDMCFFPIHWLMHKSSWGPLRRVHGYHHRTSSNALNSLETVQHSYVDGFLQVAVNIFVQQISPFGGFGHKHVMSRLAHNVLVTYLLSEAHSGYDLNWMSHRIFPEFLGGAPRHEKHHHDGRVYYQQYFKYLDDFFGHTEDKIGRKTASKATASGRVSLSVPDIVGQAQESTIPNLVMTKHTST